MKLIWIVLIAFVVLVALFGIWGAIGLVVLAGLGIFVWGALGGAFKKRI